MKLLIIAFLLFAYCFALVYIEASGDYALASGEWCKYYGCNRFDESGLKK